MPTFKSEVMQIVDTHTKTYLDRIKFRRTTTKVQKMHIAESQMRFVAETIREHIVETASKQPRAKGECPESIDERRGGIEVIGHGLDASVEFYAISYNRADGGDEEDVWGYGVSFARLVTYVNGGDQIANDCSSERLTRVVDEYLRKSLWIE